ncbi:anti-sigma factor family protein [Streptomyces sp. LaPpAH-108]|uniref:anti-sigma factor family protein n=1 Tax=Streptomyces sp. LaPpAH-108 TaxID=1155714 RepID=UPI00037FC6AB|nr:anti-sigma factor [Streptomyces sp. LaPpAH-108]
MSASRPEPATAHLAEQHLGDRLSALVDGELGHETRERVLAHLATCGRCKAEADAQRRLKNVFAQAAPPPPSESFLARLQGLPGGDPEDGDRLPGGPFGPGPDAGVFGVGNPERFAFGYVPAVPAHAAVPDEQGFRIHPVGERSASRGLRFAVAAAGAVSLAAVALGGVGGTLPGDLTADARGGSGAGSNVAPARSAGTGTGTPGTAATPETQRRRATAPLLAQGAGQLGQVPAVPTSVSAPLLPGVPSPADGRPQDTARELALPQAPSGPASPLIRPLDEITPFSVSSAAPTATWAAVPGPSAAPAPVTSPASQAP